MDDIKSAVHRLRSYAQDAAQARQTIVQGVPGGGGGVQRAGVWWGLQGWSTTWKFLMG